MYGKWDSGHWYIHVINESTIYVFPVSCLVLMEAIFPCFNLKPDDRNLPSTNLEHKLYQLHKTLILGRLGLVFLWLEWGQCSVRYILVPYLTYITEKNLMWLAAFRKKNIKSLLSKIFLVSMLLKRPCQKIVQFSEAEVAANFDITPISVQVQRFTGHIYDWIILNDWLIQKNDLLTSTWGSLCNIAKCLTQAFKGGYKIHFIWNHSVFQLLSEWTFSLKLWQRPAQRPGKQKQVIKSG